MNTVGVSFDLDFALDKESKSRKAALCEIARRIGRLRPGVSGEDVARYLLNRERLGSTAICSGVAAPHTILDDSSRPLIVVVRLAETVRFDTRDETLVDLILTVVGGRHDLDWLYAAMPRFTRIAADDALLCRLRTATSIKDVAIVLEAVGLRCEPAGGRKAGKCEP